MFLVTFTIAILFASGYNQTSEAPDYFAYAQLNLPEYCDTETLESVKSIFADHVRDFDFSVAKFFETAPITQEEFESNPEQYNDMLEKLSEHLWSSNLESLREWSQVKSYLENLCGITYEQVYVPRTATQMAIENLHGRQILINPATGGSCLIATAAFGSELSPQVQMLREIRDNTILNTSSGSAFMTSFNSFYYSFSPTVADWERQNPMFKESVKLTITPLLTTLSILNYLDIDSNAEMLGYGIGIILLNVGMYFVVPAFVIYKTRNRFKEN